MPRQTAASNAAATRIARMPVHLAATTIAAFLAPRMLTVPTSMAFLEGLRSTSVTTARVSNARVFKARPAAPTYATAKRGSARTCPRVARHFANAVYPTPIAQWMAAPSARATCSARPTLASSVFPLPGAGDEPCRQTPFSQQMLTNTRDGREETLCLLNRTTCAGMADAIRATCDVDDACGAPDVDDGRCITGTCSIPCTTERDCFDPTVGSCLGGGCQL